MLEIGQSQAAASAAAWWLYILQVSKDQAVLIQSESPQVGQHAEGLTDNRGFQRVGVSFFCECTPVASFQLLICNKLNGIKWQIPQKEGSVASKQPSHTLDSCYATDCPECSAELACKNIEKIWGMT